MSWCRRDCFRGSGDRSGPRPGLAGRGGARCGLRGVNPVIAVLLGVLFADERFGVAQFAGGLAVLVVRGEKRAKEKLASVTEG